MQEIIIDLHQFFHGIKIILFTVQKDTDKYYFTYVL